MTCNAAGACYVVPGYGTVDIRPEDGKLALDAPLPLSAWISASDTKVSVTTGAGRFNHSRSKVETFRCQPGWEVWFFTLDSPFHGKGPPELLSLATTGDRIDAARASEFWTNKMWRHGDVTWAMFETILITDTGSFGKLFCEALENIDERQVEGVRSTGANALQRARSGVIPQVTPVLPSQILYDLESNTRSATVIGAIVGGDGIGLLLTQAIGTRKDWEEVARYRVLIVLMVMLKDSLSGLLRRRLIRG